MAIKKTSNTSRFDAIKKKIAPVSESEGFFSILIYGRSGTGKTALASTFPKPMLLLDVKEKGTDTIAKVPEIDRIPIDDWDEIEQTYWYLKSGDHPYRTVVIDQITQMQDLAMTSVRGVAKEESDLISRREWGQVSGKMKTWLFNYRDLIEAGLYVVFVAHERTNSADESVEDQIDPTIGARLMPSLASAVNGAVSAIGNTFIREEFEGSGKDKVRNVRYCLRIGPHAYYTTKIRRPVDFVAPDFIVNPNFDKIVKIIRGEKAEPRRRTK
jgi:phage nucleotide-binding protein